MVNSKDKKTRRCSRCVPTWSVQTKTGTKRMDNAWCRNHKYDPQENEYEKPFWVLSRARGRAQKMNAWKILCLSTKTCESLPQSIEHPSLKNNASAVWKMSWFWEPGEMSARYNIYWTSSYELPALEPHAYQQFNHRIQFIQYNEVFDMTSWAA